MRRSERPAAQLPAAPAEITHATLLLCARCAGGRGTPRLPTCVHGLRSPDRGQRSARPWVSASLRRHAGRRSRALTAGSRSASLMASTRSHARRYDMPSSRAAAEIDPDARSLPAAQSCRDQCARRSQGLLVSTGAYWTSVLNQHQAIPIFRRIWRTCKAQRCNPYPSLDIRQPMATPTKSFSVAGRSGSPTGCLEVSKFRLTERCSTPDAGRAALLWRWLHVGLAGRSLAPTSQSHISLLRAVV